MKYGYKEAMGRRKQPKNCWIQGEKGEKEMEVKFTDNADKVRSAFEKQVIAGLGAIGVMAESHAKENCPVDTGRLRNSISNEVSSEAVYIGTNVEYAAKMELTDMDHKVGQAHFIRDAATTHNDEYKKLMEAALKD